MHATLRRLHSPDVSDLRSYHPRVENDFNVLVQAMIGPADSVGEESFDFTVQWDENAERPKWLGSRLFLKQFDYPTVLREVERLCTQAEGSDWQQVAAKLGRQLRWEFEGYSPYQTD